MASGAAHSIPGGANVTQPQIDQLCINTIRTLSMDAVQQANSGHPGAPMGMAPVAYTLWQKFLRYDPADPLWPNRDRFVLSAGHASMLLYSLLHLAQVKSAGPAYEILDEPAVSLDEIKRFRQLGGKCPGHPEYRHTSGVETTTGPLGQGVATSVGMAVARNWLAQTYNRPGFALFDYNVYALCGDGDMMEGVSAEAASLAGHLKLGNLCWIYDSNRITIEGSTDLAFDEDVAARFAGHGWHVIRVADANDLPALSRVMNEFLATGDRPTLIIVHSHIAFGAPHKQDTASAHGEPLGEEEIRLAKRNYGWPEDAKFLVPDGVYEHFRANIGQRGASARSTWNNQLASYSKQFPDLAAQLQQIQHRQLPAGWDADIPVFPADPKGLATRDSSGKILNAIAKRVPWLLGGSADLAPSNKTRLTFDGAGDLQAAAPGGRNLHFGIREHAMGSLCNGLALSKLRAYAGTFLIFCDYMRPAIRLAALMELPVFYIFTHDSIGVGEDGPTHQPIEQLAGLRATPGLIVLRPADANEVAEAYRLVLQLRREPAVLALTRQALPTLDRTKFAPAAGLAKGAYVLSDPAGGPPQAILIGTGSEVPLCLEAAEKLAAQSIRVRVVSMPSFELFERQPREYRDSVLPPALTARVAVELGSPLGWDRYAGPRGRILSMTSFGASGPIKDLQKHFGFTAEAVISAVKDVLAIP